MSKKLTEKQNAKIKEMREDIKKAVGESFNKFKRKHKQSCSNDIQLLTFFAMEGQQVLLGKILQVEKEKRRKQEIKKSVKCPKTDHKKEDMELFGDGSDWDAF